MLRSALFIVWLAKRSLQDTCPNGPPAVDTYFGGMNYTYPYPVHYQTLQTQHQTLCQAYMDVQPTTHQIPDVNTTSTAHNKTILLLHGRNFCGATWNETAHVLSSQGYRVILPDQIGFCKSSKPTAYQFSLQQLALNTLSILSSLGIEYPITVMGHSMGGMLATRLTLMYPSLVSNLILVDPLGLEDWKAKGVPYQDLQKTYTTERASSYMSIRTYEQATYYANSWDPAYDVWVNMLVSVYQGGEADKYAFDQALVVDMILTQPVVYELPQLGDTRTLLIIGKQDNTAIGKAWSPPEVQAIIGNYSVLGKQAKQAIGENCTLVEFADLGHAPQIQAPERFHNTVLDWLRQK